MTTSNTPAYALERLIGAAPAAFGDAHKEAV